MEKIMELIKKKGIDKGIQDAINKSYALTGGNISQDDITEAVKNIIRLEIIRNHDLSDAVFDAMFDKVVDKIAAELNITCQPDVCEEKGDDLKENLIEQVGNVHQGLVAILKFLS